MQALPIGIQSFEIIREDNLLYIDKTAILKKLIQEGRRYFLARPRRFGKSLTVSTLECMFQGRTELFNNLAAFDLVQELAAQHYPVISIDMSQLGYYRNASELNISILNNLKRYVIFNNIDLNLTNIVNCDELLLNLVYTIYATKGRMVILIDEYDSPILNNITDLKKVDEIREILRSFYAVLKSCDKFSDSAL